MRSPRILRDMTDLAPGDHLCWLYEGEEEHRAVITPFLRQGLERGEKVLYIVDAHPAESVLAYLREDGLEVEPYLTRGQLHILTSAETYLAQGVFDPDAMVAHLRSETARALAEGYSALRISGEMSWATKRFPGSDRLIEYEAKLNSFFPGSRCLGICQYDRRRFDPAVLLGVLSTHPTAAVGRDLYDNFYYIPPAEFLSGDLPATTLRHCLENLKQRSRSEQALRESEERFRSVLDSSMDNFYRRNLETDTYDYLSPAVERISGYSPEEILSMPLESVVSMMHPEDIDRVKHAIDELMNTGRASYLLEYRFRHKDGQYRWLSDLFTVVRDAQGHPVYLVGNVRDITDRKRAEEALRTFARQWQTTFDAIGDAVCLLDSDRRILRCNMTMSNLLGKPFSEIVGRTCWELVHSTSEPPKGCPIVAMQETRHRETLVLPVDDRWFNVTVDPLLDEDGSLIGAVHIMFDITERKRAEEAFRASQQLFERTFAALRDAAFIIDADTVEILECNPAASEIFGYSREEMLGRTTTFLHIDEAARKEFRGHLDFAIEEKGFLSDFEFRMKRNDGTVFPTEHSVMPLQDERGSRVGWVSVVRDITERKQAEEALKMQARVLESMAEGVNVSDENGIIFFTNPAFDAMFGYERGELIGRHVAILNVYSPEENARFVSGVVEKLKTQGVWLGEVGNRKKDGTAFATSTCVSALEMPGKQCWVAVQEDITERKQAEEALRYESNKVTSMLDAMEDGVCIVNQRYDIEYLNPTLTKEFGPCGERKCYEYFHDRKDVCPWCPNQKVFSGETIRWEWYSFKNRKTYDLVDTPLRDPGGNISKLEIFRDITERKRTEEALRASEELYRQLAEAAHDLIFILNRDMVVEYSNVFAARQFGRKPEEVIGMKFTQLFPPEVTQRQTANVQRVLDSGEPLYVEAPTGLTQGMTWQGTWLVPLNDASGAPRAVLGVARDITERKHAEEALVQRTRQLDAIRAVTAEISRELNLSTLLELITQRAGELVGAVTGTVRLWDEQAQILIPVAWHGLGEWMKDQCRRLGEGVSGTVAQRREGMIVNDYRTSPYAHPATLERADITAVLGEPLMYRDRLLGVLSVDKRDPGSYFTEREHEVFRLFAAQAAIAIENARLFEQVRTGRERLRNLSRRLVEVQESERRTIARELHDEVGQLLTGLKLLLETSELLSREKVEERLESARSVLNDLMTRVREMSLSLRPAMLDDLGLLPALLWHFERYTTQTNVRVNLQHSGLDRRFSPEIETAAYRIVQEALSNVARHAGVTEVSVRLWVDQNTLGVQIQDQGAGFDPEAALAAATSIGLIGMRERAALLGGSLTVESAPGAGTTVKAELPLGGTGAVERRAESRRQGSEDTEKR